MTARHPVFLYVDRNILVIEHGWSGDVIAGLPLPERPPNSHVVQLGPLVITAKGRFSGSLIVDEQGHGALEIESVRRLPDWRPGSKWEATDA